MIEVQTRRILLQSVDWNVISNSRLICLFPICCLYAKSSTGFELSSGRQLALVDHVTK